MVVINPMMCLSLFLSSFYLQIVSANELKNMFNHQQHDRDFSGKIGIHLGFANRVVRQIESDSTTSSVLPETPETSTTLKPTIDPSDEEAEEINRETTTLISDETTVSPVRTKASAKDALDEFIAGPLIVVGAISLVSLCLFLLYVCKYRSTGSSGLDESA
ncbi:uncharacterized protein LOC107370834 [Tetranychus urticae]|uniref:Syndecan/Neurexin domain-containing protein n=1 Tax=Tetranychus urticae TaxID=32264 RepID=T1JXV5_TETUR|nr:uncharacterized protein LOC107370834 [Tetranychus urticae]